MYRAAPYENLVIARLFDFFANANHWHRRLWEAGTMLTLKEVLEASEAKNAGVLSEGSLSFLCASVMPIAGRDKGVGSPSLRQNLDGLLKTELRYNGFDYLKLEYLTRQVEADYLLNWATALQTTADCPAPERTARALAGHLLDLNFHPDFLHRWLGYLVKHNPALPSLSDIVAEGHQIANQNPQDFEIYIPIESVLREPQTRPTGWLDEASFAAEFDAAGFDSKTIRHHGGLRFTISSRDVFSAVEVAGEMSDSFIGRIIVGTRNQMPFMSSKAWVKGEKKPFRLRRAGRGVEVHALERSNQLCTSGKPTIIDAAIELLAPMAFSSPSVALIGGWAAIEGLLGTSGKDRGVDAGDRMATIIACSFPRAELTNLSYQVAKGSPEAIRLDACGNQHERIMMLANMIKNNAPLVFSDPSDSAALERMRAVIADPKRAISDIEEHLKRVFRRMYRQRNLILHWGKTDATMSRTCLRSAAPLVGEGMDRIVHSYYAGGIKPIELAARARIRLETLNPTDVESIIMLLG